MLGGFNLEIGWCGFGFDAGLFPEVRLGVLRAGTYRGSLIEVVRAAERAAEAANATMRMVLAMGEKK